MKRLVPVVVFCGMLGALPASAWFQDIQLPTFTQVSLFLLASTTKQIVMFAQKGQGTFCKSVGFGVIIDSINAILIKEAASAISGAVSKKPKNEECWRRNDDLEREIRTLKSNSETVLKSERFHGVLDANLHLVSEKLKQRSKLFGNSNLEDDAAIILADLLFKINSQYPGQDRDLMYDSAKIEAIARRYELSRLMDSSFVKKFYSILSAKEGYSGREDYFKRLVDIIRTSTDSDL